MGRQSIKWVGAESGEARNFIVSVFVPSKNRDGVPIDHVAWTQATLTEMAALFGGATAFGGTGAWRDDERNGAILQEGISQVFSYTAKSSWNEENANRLAKFLRRMGRETQQGEIGLLVNGQYLPIRRFAE